MIDSKKPIQWCLQCFKNSSLVQNRTNIIFDKEFLEICCSSDNVQCLKKSCSKRKPLQCLKKKRHLHFQQKLIQPI